MYRQKGAVCKTIKNLYPIKTEYVKLLYQGGQLRVRLNDPLVKSRFVHL